MDGPWGRRASGVLSPPDHARRLARGLVALAGALVLSLGIVLVVILAPQGAIGQSSIMWRSYEGLRRGTVALPRIPSGCPIIDYSEPSCHPGLLHPPSADMSEAAVFEDMYHGFMCLVETIIDPWTPTGSHRPASFVPGGQHVRCGGGAASPINVTQAETRRHAWRGMADEQLCVLADSMYEVMTSCRFGLHRGMHIQSGRYE